MTWKNLDKEKPLCIESGNWDGKRSDLLLLSTKDGEYYLGKMYEGFLDGNEFNDFYDEDNYEIQNVTHWMYMPLIF